MNMNTETNSTTPITDVSEVARKFKAYDPQLAIPVPEGERLVKCLYKTNPKTGKAAGVNSYILVSDSHLSEQVIADNAAKLAPYVSAYLQSVEDKIVKDAHVKGSLGFSDKFLSLDKILAFLDEAGQGNRLNKEKIEAWFNSDMREPLVAAFAEKMGVSETPTEAELEKLAEITGVYSAKFASLASGKTAYRKEEAELLQKALEVTDCKDGNVIGSKFYDRLESMKTATSNELLMAL